MLFMTLAFGICLKGQKYLTDTLTQLKNIYNSPTIVYELSYFGKTPPVYSKPFENEKHLLHLFDPGVV